LAVFFFRDFEFGLCPFLAGYVSYCLIIFSSGFEGFSIGLSFSSFEDFLLIKKNKLPTASFPDTEDYLFESRLTSDWSISFIVYSGLLIKLSFLASKSGIGC
jgi:hypothetical protein